MKTIDTRWLVTTLLCGAFMIVRHANAAEPRVSVDGDAVTIATDRYEVVWRDGSMVALTTLLPGRVELTSKAAATDVAQFPNGLGSFHGVLPQAVYAQHHPWGGITGPFPAQHPPGKDTELETEPVPGGVRLTYRGLAGDPGASLVQELTVDAGTGDLVIRQEGESPDPGVFGISFSVFNLRPDVELIVPYFGGQRWGPDMAKGQLFSVGWTRFWSAGFVIGQVPGAGGGTFIVRAEDPEHRPKFFRRLVNDDTQALGFESAGEAPYDQARRHEAFAWRFNTYAGDWTQPAAAYKAWMVDAFDMVPRGKRSSAWVDDVSLIWPTHPGDPGLATLAQAVDPKRVLLMDFGMLRDFNRRIPEYRPAEPDYADRVAAARALGYRVGCYTSLGLIDQETHPSMMKDYGLDYFYTGLLEDKPAPKDWLVYVHPGSVKWREFYAGKMLEVHEKLGLDFTYQDVVGGSLGSTGVVEGKNYNQAVLAGETAIREKVPAMALGGEYWTEVNAAREDFGLTQLYPWGGEGHWNFISRPDQPHPILSYLFSEFCLHWPHQVPLRDTSRFHRDQNVNEVTGAIPVWNTDADDRSGEARMVLERARLFAEGFRPYFPEPWDRGAVSYMRNPAGQVVRYVRRGQSTFCFEQTAQGDRLRYGRVTGESRVSDLPGDVTIDGWVGYGADGPIGLDAARWYCVFPAGEAAPAPPLRLTALPEGAVITGTRVTDDYALVQLGAAAGAGDAKAGDVTFAGGRKPLFVSTGAGRQEPAAANGSVRVNGPAWLLFGFNPPEKVDLDAPLPLERWRAQLVANGQVAGRGKLSEPEPRDIPIAGQSRRAVRVGPPLGGVGSELSIDGFVSLPDGPGLALKLSAGLFGTVGDGMNFVVRVNGQEVWRQFRESADAGWRDVTIPLKAYAGQAVVLSFAVDCGPSGFNTSCDDSAWGDVRLVAE